MYEHLILLTLRTIITMLCCLIHHVHSLTATL